MFDKLILASLRRVPQPVMRRLAARYIAGETLDEALAELAGLAQRGHAGILDILGENVATDDAARAAAGAYREALLGIAQRKLDPYVSIKPTHPGLALSEKLCLGLYRELARECAQNGLFLRVEMEDHPTTDATLRIFEALRTEFDNVGIVLQARLFRTPDDIRGLAPGRLDVRVVKGVYLEPKDIAHTDVLAIRAAYVECTRLLIERGARLGLATHDDILGEELIALARGAGLTQEDYEFQVLMGVRMPLWQQWKQDGHRVRVYIPYGPEWRAYSTRRLAKNPQILRHVIRDTLTSWISGSGSGRAG